jgi:hypothetical protein
LSDALVVYTQAARPRPALRAQCYGPWLPKGTPKNITAKLNAAVIEALADPMMRARLADGGDAGHHDARRHRSQRPPRPARRGSCGHRSLWPSAAVLGSGACPCGPDATVAAELLGPSARFRACGLVAGSTSSDA